VTSHYSFTHRSLQHSSFLQTCRSPLLSRSPSPTAVRPHLPFHAFERLPRGLRCG
jgi:hypothetical protein